MAEQNQSTGVPDNTPPEDRPHKPADDREEVYFDGSPLLRAEIGKLALWALIAAVLIAVVFVWDHFFPNHKMHWGVIVALVLLALAAALIPILLIRTIRYRVSNYRIDFERGMLSKQIDTIELWHVEDISLHQSLLDRILRTGTITIISHDETNPRLSLLGVPNPRPLFELMKQRIIAVKRQRGVIKMDVG
jgi:membrane protein YdbS with pleckstrin-like domain